MAAQYSRSVNCNDTPAWHNVHTPTYRYTHTNIHTSVHLIAQILHIEFNKMLQHWIFEIMASMKEQKTSNRIRRKQRKRSLAVHLLNDALMLSQHSGGADERHTCIECEQWPEARVTQDVGPWGGRWYKEAGNDRDCRRSGDECRSIPVRRGPMDVKYSVFQIIIVPPRTSCASRTNALPTLSVKRGDVTAMVKFNFWKCL